ncbi:MAG: metallophosphoesterase [Clostridiales bacterium]|nr:metallophosphoesterase [Clostridiales bacterium]MCF8023466.1 metallophosphoesterase [Clostridiales bacterium]
MKIFTISDLHLSFSYPVDPNNWQDAVEYKPMSEVDETWFGHARRIYDNWINNVSEDDIVLLAGDISWAMKLEETYPDFDYLSKLPGHIVAVQGNHDYWWQSISRVRQVAPPNMSFIQNDHVMVDSIAICGTRGWVCPGGKFFSEHDSKIYRRELIRLENSLNSISKKRDSLKDVIVMMHYMPTNEKHEYSGFIDVLKKFGVKKIIYGHLHAKACNYRLPDWAWGMNFILTSADYLGFKPLYLGNF